jgi:hypothetical protein
MDLVLRDLGHGQPKLPSHRPDLFLRQAIGRLP